MSETITFIWDTPDPEYSKNSAIDTKEIKKAFKIEQSDIGVFVYAVAISKRIEQNKLLEIYATGTPLNVEVHNMVRDCFHIEGVDFYEIGSVPVSYRIMIPDTTWEEDIPLPFSVIRRYLTENQLKSYMEWKAKYKKGYVIQYVQTLGVF